MYLPEVLFHSSIRFEKPIVVYCDPFTVNTEYHDAEYILITHDHFDHFSYEDCRKVQNENTTYICPFSCVSTLENAGISSQKIIGLQPGECLSKEDITVEAVPAYNVGKPFHSKDKNYLGYIIVLDSVRYYICGDTDRNEENSKVQCDVMLVPIGGKYTMNCTEAAAFVNEIRQLVAIATHYGSGVVNPEETGTDFIRNVKEPIQAILPW